eukprot:PhM_4_TR3606/c0_g1_i1/m.49894
MDCQQRRHLQLHHHHHHHPLCLLWRPPTAQMPSMLRCCGPVDSTAKFTLASPTSKNERQFSGFRSKKVPCDDSVDVHALAEAASGGYSGAECVAVCKEAALYALETDMQCEVLTSLHLTEALKRVKPRQKQF